MSIHQTDAYKDGYVWVVYCKVCGDENPSGDCPGRYVPHGKREKEKVSVNNCVDNRLKCE